MDYNDKKVLSILGIGASLVIILFAIMIAITNASKKDDAIEVLEIVEETTQEVFCDELFLNNMEKALSERWNKQDPDNMDKLEVVKKYYKELVMAEMNILGDYRMDKFEDSQLQELAIAYYNGLKSQLEITEGNDSEDAFYEKWKDATVKRAGVIYELYENYGLRFNSGDTEKLKVVFTFYFLHETGWESMLTMLNAGDMEFEIKDERNVATWEIINTTDYEFYDLEIGLGLRSEEDENLATILEESFVIRDWKPGEKTTVTFTFDDPEGFKGKHVNMTLLPLQLY